MVDYIKDITEGLEAFTGKCVLAPNVILWTLNVGESVDHITDIIKFVEHYQDGDLKDDLIRDKLCSKWYKGWQREREAIEHWRIESTDSYWETEHYSSTQIPYEGDGKYNSKDHGHK